MLKNLSASSKLFAGLMLILLSNTELSAMESEAQEAIKVQRRIRRISPIAMLFATKDDDGTILMSKKDVTLEKEKLLAIAKELHRGICFPVSHRFLEKR